MTGNSDSHVDEKLRDAILSCFAGDVRTASTTLRVGVMHRIAHLAGVAGSLEIYNAAAELAKGVSGVRGVVNRIEAPGAPNPSRTIDLNFPEINSHGDDQAKAQD